MKVLLIDLENHFDNLLLEEGLGLVRATNEYTIQQPDPAHYQLNAAQPVYQVDMLMLADGMVNAKCFCAPFKKTRQCKHIVAGLLILRDHLIHNRKISAKSSPEQQEVEEVLRKIKITDLRQFISEYARSHSTFRAELLANSLHLTKKPDYAGLLLDLTPINKYGQIKINRNTVKTLRGIVSILLKQTQDLFREKALPETFQILAPVIAHLYRLIFKFPQYLPQLSTELKTALRLFESLTLQPMAPRLQLETIRFAIDQSGKEGYFILKNSPPLLRMVESFVLEEKMKSSMMHLIENKIKTDANHRITWTALWIRWIRLWKLKSPSKEILAFIQPLLPEVILEMNQQRDYEDLLAATAMVNAKQNAGARRASLSVALKAALLLDRPDEKIRYGSELASEYFDLDAWNELERSSPHEAKIVLDEVERKYVPGQSELADQMLLHGYYQSGLHRELLDRLILIEDPLYMMEYDTLLLRSFKEEVVEFYARHIRFMKEAYGGVLARQKLNNIFSHLKSLDLYSAVADKVKEMDAKKSDPTPPAGIAGFIFDLDGVIVDTAIHHFEGWKKVMQELGHTITEEDDHHTRGAGRMESLDYLLTKYKEVKTVEEKLDLATRKNKYYLESIEGITPDDLLPGVKHFLLESRELGLLLALGSASKNAREVLKKLEVENLFDAILTGHDAKESKPHPEIFIKGCEALKLDPSRVVVFEDAGKGVAAALAAGCHCVGIGTPETLNAADIVVPNLLNVTPSQIIEQLS